MNLTPRLFALGFLCFIPVLQAREPQASPPSTPQVIRARALGIPFDGTPGANNDEVALDIEMALSMAPGLSRIIVYQAGPYGLGNDILNRAESVIAFARGHLAGYKLPRSIAFMAEIPRTESGKILKRVLREPYWRGHETRVL